MNNRSSGEQGSDGHVKALKIAKPYFENLCPYLPQQSENAMPQLLIDQAFAKPIISPYLIDMELISKSMEDGFNAQGVEDCESRFAEIQSLYMRADDVHDEILESILIDNTDNNKTDNASWNHDVQTVGSGDSTGTGAKPKGDNKNHSNGNGRGNGLTDVDTNSNISENYWSLSENYWSLEEMNEITIPISPKMILAAAPRWNVHSRFGNFRYTNT